MELTEILQNRFGITEEVLTEARQAQLEKGGRMGDILVQRKALSEAQVLEALSLLYDVPFWPELPLESMGNAEYAKKVSIQFLKRHYVVPLVIRSSLALSTDVQDQAADASLDATVVIATNDPGNFSAVDDLAQILELNNPKVVISTRQAILSAINISYDLNQDSAQQLVQDMEDESTIISEIEDTADLLEDTSDAPIIKLVNHILSQAIKARASDIHIEPYQDSFKVRYRVDGILFDLLSPPKWIQPNLISRIKVMAKLNIAEKRLPQDGRFEVKIGNQNIDIRVSTLPTSFGERIVMRLLNKSSSVFDLKELGLSTGQLNQIQELASSPNGIVLVTGPTGSGKTTTLYSILSSINTPEINIITIEDPVEYQLKGISQIQVNPKIDLSFARGLRSIVRQDPDVILVGEIRDQETAEIAVQSALTGHLVFSTLHTNDSASAITRLVDIGIEPFLISSSVLAVIAQRLVRKLCEYCKEPYQPDTGITTVGLSTEELAGATFFKAKGCDKCLNTGYRGRIGIYEIMIMGYKLKSLIQQTYDSFQIKEEALNLGMITLRRDGFDKVQQGITTMEEVARATHK